MIYYEDQQWERPQMQIDIICITLPPKPLWFWEWHQPMTLADWGIKLISSANVPKNGVHLQEDNYHI